MTEDTFFNRSTIPPLPPYSLKKLPPIPEKIGPYPIETLLDKGGMSLLYLATDPKTAVPITIKVLSPKFLSHPEMTARFLKEAEIIALADHPNIVKLYGYGEWEEGLYIAMEFIKGVSLRQYILQNPLSLRRALELVLEIAYALCHLHTHGVIHRDLKPENILINGSGHVKVIDFGIAQLISPYALEKLQPGKRQLMGTPVYMSPEQKDNPENVSYPSDIYSLGIIAYELMIGRLSSGHIHLSLLPKGLQKILAKALQPFPKDRYMDIVDLITDISAYLHSPQFEKEKKLGDQAGELYEKMHILQQAYVAIDPKFLPQVEFGYILQRPLGFSGIYAKTQQTNPHLIFAKSLSSEITGFLQMVYFKGLIDSILLQNLPITSCAAQINEALIHSSFHEQLSLGILTWDDKKESVQFLSCGFGALWQIVPSQPIQQFDNTNLPLGATNELPFQITTLPIIEKMRLIVCPCTDPLTPFTTSQFEQYLEEFSSLDCQKMAEALYRKAHASNIRYFDDHPFLLAVIEF